MERKNIKRMIEDGEMVVGLTCQLLDPAVAEIAGLVGFDYLRLEGEHLSPDWSDLRQFVTAADAVGIPLIIRVTSLDDITAINDLGVAGYQIPRVQSAEHARQIVDLVKYAPVGSRGYSRYVRAQRYGITPFAEYKQFADDEMLLIIQIEDRAGIENLEEIAAVEGIDVICSGKGDISQALGILGDLDSERVREVELRIIEAAKRNGKKLMILGRDREDWIALLDQDACVITEHATDVALLAKAAADARADMEFLKVHKREVLARRSGGVGA